jgi:TLC ATP/ADP transporter
MGISRCLSFILGVRKLRYLPHATATSRYHFLNFHHTSNRFANEITSVDEAKKYYSLFGLMANVALIFSGQYVKYVSNLRVGLPPGELNLSLHSMLSSQYCKTDLVSTNLISSYHRHGPLGELPKAAHGRCRRVRCADHGHNGLDAEERTH